MKRSKAYRQSVAMIDKNKLYEITEAIELAQKTSTVKFPSSIDVSMKLGVDPKKADQLVRGTIVLPHGTGKTSRVLVFAQGPKASEAQEAGADFVGGDELVTKVSGGWSDYDVIVATPDMMGKVGKLGKVLGPRGLMPNPKTGTVTMDVAKIIGEIKSGRIEFRVDKNSNLHCSIGKSNFNVEQLFENFTALYDEIIRIKPATSKGRYIQKIVLSSTMGPGIPVNHTAMAS